MAAEKKKTGRIYKILNLNDENDLYIASTYDKITKKLWRLKKDIAGCGFPMSILQYKMKKGNKDNFRIELVEEKDFPTKTDMIRAEMKYIEKLNPNLNKIVKNELEAEEYLKASKSNIVITKDDTKTPPQKDQPKT